MAVKLTITTSLAWTDGIDSMAAKGSSVTVPAGAGAAEIIQNVATTITALSLGGITPGHVFFENKDTVNPVTIASDDAMANIVCVLKPKESFVLGTSVTAFWGQASNAPCSVLVLTVAA
jgi:hypothetical protein